MGAELSSEAERLANWEQRVRIFGILVTAVPSVVIAWLLLFTFVGEWAGVGPAQQLVIWLALAVEALVIAVSWREPPVGRRLLVIRGACVVVYVAVAGGAMAAVWPAISGKDESTELWSIAQYLMLGLLIRALFDRCVDPDYRFRSGNPRRR